MNLQSLQIGFLLQVYINTPIKLPLILSILFLKYVAFYHVFFFIFLWYIFRNIKLKNYFEYYAKKLNRKNNKEQIESIWQ